MEITNDPLWKTAQKRAAFKHHVIAYIIINAFFWGIWYFTGAGYPWPVWPMLGWGIGLAFNYVHAYMFDHDELVKREYENLKKEREKVS